jgi:hypothetical protein
MGPQGDWGERGETGLQGARGERGETGPQGLRGETGQAGPQGQRGIQGERGPAGETPNAVMISDFRPASLSAEDIERLHVAEIRIGDETLRILALS